MFSTIILDESHIFLHELRGDMKQENAGNESIGKEKKIGRPALHELHPEILTYIQDFISSNAIESADERRRNNQSYVGGFTSNQLLTYIKEQFHKNQGKVLQISEKTIQRYFIAPHKGHKNAVLYKNIFDVKVLGSK